MRNNIDFTTITACGECCVGCKKKENENIMSNSVDYVKNFLVSGLFKK